MSFSSDTIIKLNNELEVLMERYSDVPVSDLIQEMNISSKSKNLRNSLTRRLISYANMKMLTLMEENDELTIKSIKLDKYGKLKEAVSFPAFDYCKLAAEEWENSSLRKTFYEKMFVFTVYQTRGKEDYLRKIVVWQMPSDVLESGVRKVWEQMRDCLLEGNIVKYIDDSGRYHSFFPSSTENPYMHVRPHAKDRNDTKRLPMQDKLTGLIEYPKHSFWLNRAYVLKIITK